ncbi:cobalt uptake protein with substrate-specific transmembrane region [Breoghania corrubedonensis]|uniref:Cobalt uptake protein with substrate-specific transmembrane region n=1 Tax=Breoghania corrubedonensis TaxID=665038 RepID=A0A2T5V6Q1_9HYPH|nr:energy-coupling factor ABC transporter permease [Breoghania corrubedonensis]PTW59432.1 cobalt uptake protein with substrate-specific transmembrane region [Breoghania corrubedonensis]
MHIEPGVVDGAKIVLSYATGAAALGLAGKMALDTVRESGNGLGRIGGASALAARTVITTALVFCFFQVLPHHPVGVSEVHLILGSTLFLIFGAGPASLGLALGLLFQGLFFAPFDLPQYGMNVTTIIVPLYAMSFLAKRIIPAATAYKDVKYSQALALSTAYQGGIVCWVGFWALYGQGFGAENMANVASFGAAYMTVIIVEPLVDLGVLAGAKALDRLSGSGLVQSRLYQPAA